MSSIFNEYPLEHLYDEFNDYAEDKYSQYCNFLKEKNSLYPGIYDFCKKLENNLKKIIKNELKNDLLKNPCAYLNYWVNNELHNMFPSDNVKYMNVISMLRSPWINIYRNFEGNGIKCVYPSLSFITNYNTEKLYELENYLHNCKFIDEQKVTLSSEYKKYYCKYISNFSRIYNPFISMCHQKTHIDCSKLAAVLSDCNPQNLLEQLNCRELQAPKLEIQRGGDHADIHTREEVLGIKSPEFNSFNILPSFVSITPIESSIRKYIIKNKKTKINYNNHMNSTLIENSSDGVDINYENIPIHLSYEQV
ncbi:PIR protein [Plasmodium ovale]|uniref:PIR Superfamily Protein n=2 Tax=Plasmodium ovale TaxID=36330 RepID=A0A1A8XDF1_PLAOA|nr:PIR Superfamily Protein [Plasmodium ovale curtisi]SBT83135.1 PIR protein [Plasmodium ovale]